MSDEIDYCGCCGNEIPDDGTGQRLWCVPCAMHVAVVAGVPPWERTFESIYGVPCPYQVTTDPSESS